MGLHTHDVFVDLPTSQFKKLLFLAISWRGVVLHSNFLLSEIVRKRAIPAKSAMDTSGEGGAEQAKSASANPLPAGYASRFTQWACCAYPRHVTGFRELPLLLSSFDPVAIRLAVFSLREQSAPHAATSL